MMAGLAPAALNWYNQRTADQLGANNAIAGAGFQASGINLQGANQLNMNNAAFANNAQAARTARSASATLRCASPGPRVASRSTAA